MDIIMKLMGTFVNCGTVLIGSAVGLLLKKGIPKRIEELVMSAVGLSVLFIGISGLDDSKNTIVLILSMVLGTVIGSLLNIDKGVKKLGDLAEKKLQKNRSEGQPSFSEGLVTSTLVFCVGAMTVVGSLQSGLTLDHSTIYSKAVLDLITSAILASSLGIGVMASIVPLFVYQGGIALLASVLEPILTETMIGEMSAVGSLLIVALALNLLKITNIKLMNMIPAIFMPMAIYPIMDLIIA